MSWTRVLTRFLSGQGESRTGAPLCVDLLLLPTPLGREGTADHSNKGTAALIGRGMGRDEWLHVLDRLAEIEVKRVRFSGAAPASHPALIELTAHASELGLRSELITDGRRLAKREFLRGLLGAGLAWTHFLLRNAKEAAHDRALGQPGAHREALQGLRNLLEERGAVTLHAPLGAPGSPEAFATIALAAELGVPQVGLHGTIEPRPCSGTAQALPTAPYTAHLEALHAAAAEQGIEILISTRRCCRILSEESASDILDCPAGRTLLCIEPDGYVSLCECQHTRIGHFLLDPWPTLWNHPALQNPQG